MSTKYEKTKRYLQKKKAKGYKQTLLLLSPDEDKDLQTLMLTHGLKNKKQAYKFLMDSYRFLFQMEQK